MAVPVQTWGSMGTMVKEQREFGAFTSDYLEKNEVYDLFGQLLKQLLVEQPENPIAFLKEQLGADPPLTVCVIGPPGIERRLYCKRLAEDFKVSHIHVGQLLRGNRDVSEQVAAGSLIDDDLVIATVREAVKKTKGKGYILDGFPRTMVQAKALAQKDMGFSLDNVLLLNAREQAIKDGFAAKLALGKPPTDKEDTINKRLQQYSRHVLGIADMLKNVIRPIQVSASDEQAVTYVTIKRNIHLRPYSNATQRPHRVCIVGACGSGRTTQATFVAKQFGLVHVDVATLVRKLQQERKQIIEDLPLEYISDEDLCMLVGRRLTETDCVRKGWVLDGFPRTPAQAEFLRQAHLWPTRLVALQCTLEIIVGRTATRRIDPETCTAYYLAPSSVAIRQRLKKTEHDGAEAVAQRFKMYTKTIDNALQTFASISLRIQGSEPVDAVSQTIMAFVDAPLPSELAQKRGD